MSFWINTICQSGLCIDRVEEPCASPELAAAVPLVADTRQAPLFLHIRVVKPADSGRDPR